jgi:hypothetical protein
MQRQIERTRRHPARLFEGEFSEQALEEMLIGTESHPIMKAVVGLLNIKVAEMGDAATERPALAIPTSGGMVRGYSEEERLYDAGGCAQAAEFLGRLQQLAKPKDAGESAAAS